jgi:hypothetical protein
MWWRATALRIRNGRRASASRTDASSVLGICKPTESGSIESSERARDILLLNRNASLLWNSLDAVRKVVTSRIVSCRLLQ